MIFVRYYCLSFTWLKSDVIKFVKRRNILVVYICCAILIIIAFGSLSRDLVSRNKNKRLDILSSILVLLSGIALLIYRIFLN